eukprot:bmy_17910T0
MVAKRNPTRRAKKIEIGTETIVGDMVGHQDGGEVPAVDESFEYGVSMLGKGVGDVGEAKGRSTTGSQFLEQFKTAQALVQLAAQHSQSGTTTTSSWDMGSTTQSLSLMQYDLKNPNDSTVHSPFTKRQPFTPSSIVMEVFLQEKPPAVATSTATPPPHPTPCSPLPSKSTSAPQMSPGSSDNQSSAGSAKTETAEEKSLRDF